MKRRTRWLPATVGVVFVALGVLVSWIALQPPKLVVVGPESGLNSEAKRELFERHHRILSYPAEATDVFFRLEPGAFEKQEEVFGEYLRFKADEATIHAFVQEQIGETNRTEIPLGFSAWHFGVAAYSWWQPDQVEDPEYYEKGEYFMTIDWTNRVVYFSYVRVPQP